MRIILLVFTCLCFLLSATACSLFEDDTSRPTGSRVEHERSDESSLVPTEDPSPTPSATPTPETTPEPTPELIDYKESGGAFELPVNGASGYASISLNLYSEADLNSQVLMSLSPGYGFTILEEIDTMWKVDFDGNIGFIEHKFCLINLPDIIPSIVYDNGNTYSSKMISSGYVIPNITGQALYSAKDYNQRLSKDEYIVPVLYTMASKIMAAQDMALKSSSTLIINEGFRPYQAQMQIVNEVTNLMNANEVVKSGLTTDPWNINWFIATSVSNHQMGYAIDVSLGKVEGTETMRSGNYIYEDVSFYSEYQMPTPIHELSNASVVFAYPIDPNNKDAWHDVPLSEAMSTNEWAIRLQAYCSSGDLTPLASEWWHFNDLDSMNNVLGTGTSGNYIISKSFSKSPENII